MTEQGGAWAVELLLDEAWDAYGEDRYQQALAAARRAVTAAEQLDDPDLLVRALETEAGALHMLGDFGAALTRYTKVLSLAEDPATSRRLDQPATAEAIFRAYTHWVGTAGFLGGFPRRRLFEVLDAADRWLAATGHHAWRASLLVERADVHRQLGELDAAVAAAEEALAAYQPGAPGTRQASLRSTLGDILHLTGRVEEAEPHYQAILDEPASSPFDRKVAYQGLARCALGRDDVQAARRHARAAVRLAEPLGDSALSTALDVLVDACRAGGDLDAAWQAVTRYREAAGRVGGHDRPYFAARAAVDVALDRGDLAAAEELLAELDGHAAALDADTGNTTFAEEVAARLERLAQLQTQP